MALDSMMNLNRAAAQAFQSHRGVAIYLGNETPMSRVWEHQPHSPLVVVSPGTQEMPTAMITYDAAQRLITDLWNAGFRPQGQDATAGQVKAMESHLADLRNVATKLLDKVVAA